MPAQTLLEKLEILSEARPVKVTVVRDGKMVKKWKCPDGFAVEWDGKAGEGIPKCRRMTAAEKKQLSRKNKLAAKKSKGKRKLAAKKAKRSKSKGKRTNVYARNRAKLSNIRGGS